MKKPVNHLLLFLASAVISVAVNGCKSGVSASASGSGKDAPPVAFKNLQGQDLALTSLKGKVVVLNFWATWCEPCRIEIPWMIGFQDKYAAKGFTMLGVAMDDEGKSVVEPYVEKTQFDVDGHQEKMNYPIVLGNDDLAAKFGGLIGLPTTVIISKDGKIAKRFIGLANHDELQKEIESLL
jgi:thiol-disulfide isomerase/thioredoxin